MLTLTEFGDFAAEIENSKDQMPGSDSGGYVSPTTAELAEFATLASYLLAGDLTSADGQADALGYDVVEFTDSASGDLYYMLRDDSSAG